MVDLDAMKKLFFVVFLIICSANAQVPTIGWQKTIGGSLSDDITIVKKTPDGGYILGGSSNSNISGEKSENSKGDFDYWIVKVNGVGEIEWQHTIGGALKDLLTSLLLTSDGGYLLGGHSLSEISGDKSESCRGNSDYWIVKVDSLGNIQWDKTIGGSEKDELNVVDQTIDGNYILGGNSLSGISGEKSEICRGGADYWILKIAPTGTILWDRTYGGTLTDFYAQVARTSDGGCIVAGQSFSAISGDRTVAQSWTPDCWILKLDENGNIQWQKGYRVTDIGSITESAFGGFIISGTSFNVFYTRDIDSYQDYAVIVRLNNSGNYMWHFNNQITGNDCIAIKASEDTNGNIYFLTRSSPGWNSYVTKISPTGSSLWNRHFVSSGIEYPGTLEFAHDGGIIAALASDSNTFGDKAEDSRGLIDMWIIKFQPENLAIPDPEAEPNTFIAYPVPVDNLLYIKNNNVTTEFKLEITNAVGQIVHQQNYNSLETIKINFPFPKGIYVVRCQSGTAKSQIIKIIK